MSSFPADVPTPAEGICVCNINDFISGGTAEGGLAGAAGAELGRHTCRIPPDSSLNAADGQPKKSFSFKSN